MITVHCDHCQQKVSHDFVAGVSVRLGKKCEYRFHLCEEHMNAFEQRMLGFLTFPAKTSSIRT